MANHHGSEPIVTIKMATLPFRKGKRGKLNISVYYLFLLTYWFTVDRTGLYVVRYLLYII